MPFVYDSNLASSQNIYTSPVQILNYTMSRDGVVCPTVVLSQLAASAATFTMTVETFNTGNYSLGVETFSTVKSSSDIQQYRVQFDRSIFLPNGHRVKVSIRSSYSGDTGVSYNAYFFDPTCASDVIAIEGQTLSSKVGDNINALFHNAGNDTTRTLDDLATPADVNAQVLDVVNVDTLIDGKTVAAALKIIAAVVAGKVSGAGTGSEVFRSLNDSANRVSVTVDAEGNRTAVSYS